MKPKHYKPQYAVAQTVADMQRKFVYPDEDTPAPGLFVGGGGGAPTVVVAANNATDMSKGKADLLCTGVDDGAAIEAAADIAGIGGRILLTEGDFQCDTRNLFIGGNITIQGMGRSTFLITQAPGVFLEFTGAEVTIKDLAIIGSSATVPNLMLRFDSAYGIAENVGFVDAARAIELQNQSYWIRGCNTTNVPIFVDGTPFGSDVKIESNGLSNTAFEGVGRIILGASAENWLIAHNRMDGGIEDSGAAVLGVQIIGNIWNEVNHLRAAHAIIDFGGASGGIDNLVVANNIVLNGSGATFLRLNVNIVRALIQGNITVVDVDDGIVTNGLGLGCVIADNSLICAGTGISTGTNFWEDGIIEGNYIDAGEHGMNLAEMLRGSIIGNTIYRPGLLTNNTFDGILLSGNSDDNAIQDNRIVVFPAGNAARYGINISAATCNNNAVYANYLGQSANYGTADSNDAGTGTQVAPAAGAIGGQFAY